MVCSVFVLLVCVCCVSVLLWSRACVIVVIGVFALLCYVLLWVIGFVLLWCVVM